MGCSLIFTHLLQLKQLCFKVLLSEFLLKRKHFILAPVCSSCDLQCLTQETFLKSARDQNERFPHRLQYVYILYCKDLEHEKNKNIIFWLVQ